MIYRHIHTFKEHKGPVYALCHAPAKGEFFSAGADRNVIRWNADEKKGKSIIAKAPTTIISLLYIEAYNILLIGQVEGGVHIIDLEKGTEIKYLKVHQGYIFDIKYIVEKDELVLASGDGSISVWSMPDYKLLWQEKLAEQKIRKLDYSQSRQELAVASGDGELILLNVLDWTIKHRLRSFGSSINVVRYHPYEATLFAGEKDALLHQLDLVQLELKKKLPAHYWAIYDLLFSPNGSHFATASRDKTVKIWDTQKVVVLKRFEGLKDKAHTHSVNKLLWLNGNQLISTGDDGSIRMWSID